MDCSRQQAAVSDVRGGARRGTILAALLLAVASGCANTGPLIPWLGEKASPPVTQVAVIWKNQVLTGVDPLNNGAPMAGLSCRVFLFGPDEKDYLLAQGKLVIELYATLPEQPQAPPTSMGRWEIGKEILNSACLRKDSLGLGYTLNLPWEKYRPDIRQLQMRTRYEPEKGLPTYAESMVTLNSGPEATPKYTQRTFEPGNRQVITAAAPPGAGPQAGTVQQVGGVQAPAQPAFEMNLSLPANARH
jgi:hypothetical protein